MKISLIIPVYNAASTLPSLLQSVAAQSFRDFEVVFIDDASTDGSAAVMEQFAAGSGLPVQILRQATNRGVAAARNRGMDAARGGWISFADADDLLDPEALGKAANAATEGVDIVGWDWTLGFEKNGRHMRQSDYVTPLEALMNLMEGTMRWNLWLFMVRRNLIETKRIRFVDGANMGEDMQFMIKAFCSATKVAQLHNPFYRYNALNTSSISRQFSEVRRAEITTNFQEAVAAIHGSTYAKELDPLIPQLQLFLKRPLLISPDRNNYETWYHWFPEANAFAARGKSLPLRIRLLQGMAARRRWTGVRLYYFLVYKFVYGILFR